MTCLTIFKMNNWRRILIKKCGYKKERNPSFRPSESHLDLTVCIRTSPLYTPMYFSSSSMNSLTYEELSSPVCSNKSFWPWPLCNDIQSCSFTALSWPFFLSLYVCISPCFFSLSLSLSPLEAVSCFYSSAFTVDNTCQASTGHWTLLLSYIYLYDQTRRSDVSCILSKTSLFVFYVYVMKFKCIFKSSQDHVHNQMVNVQKW